MSAARFFKSTSKRTFIVYPVVLLLVEWLLQGENLSLQPWGAPLLPWGYLQYRLAGMYRTRLGGGGPGLRTPPERLVTTGIYAYTRNPMYLGHLIYITGLAILLRSYVGLLLLIIHVPWFHRRVAGDEQRMQDLFGDEYTAYAARVKRWVPGIF